MIDFHCACLVHIVEGRLLLVKVRENEKYYLPGGKIERGEAHEATLIRELKEELKIEVDLNSLDYIGKVVGPAYPDTTKTVALECYRIKGQLPNVEPNMEITVVKYLDMSQTDLMAPAVIRMVEDMGMNCK